MTVWVDPGFTIPATFIDCQGNTVNVPAGMTVTQYVDLLLDIASCRIQANQGLAGDVTCCIEIRRSGAVINTPSPLSTPGTVGSSAECTAVHGRVALIVPELVSHGHQRDRMRQLPECSNGTEAVRLYVFDGTDNGGLRASDDAGNVKADLFVDAADQGTLVLRDSNGSEAVRLYVGDDVEAGASGESESQEPNREPVAESGEGAGG